ncbi:hypothetical protein PM082_015232 [Marasmius tenuissimus]|nr:hypothetical protein PM082_015232 [Marasmius tenuissimus]
MKLALSPLFTRPLVTVATTEVLSPQMQASLASRSIWVGLPSSGIRSKGRLSRLQAPHYITIIIYVPAVGDSKRASARILWGCSAVEGRLQRV